MARPKGKIDPNLDGRRAKVAKLLTSRVSQTDIATALGVSQATISRDVKHIRRQWQREMVEDLGEVLAQDLAELSEIERAAAIEFSAQPSGKRATKWLHVRIRCKEVRAKLLGLDEAHAAQAAARAMAAATTAMSRVRKDVESMTTEQIAAEYERAVLLGDGAWEH